MGTDLTGAKLIDVHLDGADLTGANLTDVDASGLILKDVIFSNAILKDTLFRDNLDFKLESLNDNQKCEANIQAEGYSAPDCR